MDKQQIKDQLLNQQRRLIEELKEQSLTVHSMVDIDESSTNDPEDYSHQFESGEIEQLLKIQKNRAERGLEVISNLDISPKSTVQTGAFIETDLLTFVIGYATLPFEMDGMRYVGISVNSPIYAMMTGKKTGDTFNYSGNYYRITNIY